MGGKDGYNVGFIFNASLKEENDDCSRGINCMIEESITELVSKYQDILESELDVFQQVSIEEWEIVMPTRHERTEKVMSLITDEKQVSGGQCNYCTKWMMEAIEVK